MQNQQIKFLVASDLHLEYNQLKKLICKEIQNKFDFILLLGDFLNLSHQPNEDQQIEELQKIIEPFKQFGCPIYYIPGNHDCEGLFNKQQLVDGCINLHQSSIQISQNLTLVGLGGSIPGYNKNGKFWEGYPYRNDEEYCSEIKQLEIPKEGNVILLSHIGPAISQTTVSFELSQEDPIKSGSDSLSCFINEHKNIILNIHGHTHDGVGTRRVGHCKVVNAGPLLYGNYCIISVSDSVDKIEHIFI